MRYWFLCLILLISPTVLRAANDDPALTPRCGGPFQLCGYAEKDSGILRVPQRFEVAERFHDRLAAVRVNGLYGYIDAEGNMAVAPLFYAAGPFTGHYAEVRTNSGSGIIDRTGRLVVPPNFRRIIPFANDTFVAEPMPANWRTLSREEVRLQGFSDTSPFLGLGRAGLYHLSKGWLTEQDLKFARFDAAARGLVWAGKENGHHDQTWGLLKSDGAWKVSPRYGHVQALSDTHAVARSLPDYSMPPAERREAVRWGAVDRNGELVVPLQFDHLSYWRDGYGIAHEGKPFVGNVRQETKRGIVLADGKLLSGRYFDDVEIPGHGALPRGRLGVTWFSIEADGRLVSDQNDGTPIVECAGGLTIIERGTKVEFRKAGDSKPGAEFDKTYIQSRDCPGPFSASRDGRWFFILEDGSVVGEPRGFDNTYSFNAGYAAVQIDGRWGIIDRTGAFTVQPGFPKLRPDRQNSYAVGEGESTYWINAAGERVGKPNLKPTPEQALVCKGGLRFFQKAGLWGFQDSSGKTVISARFRALACFSQGVSWAAAPDKKGWCPIGPEGHAREAMACRDVYYPMLPTDTDPEVFDPDPYENSVLWSRAWLDYQAGKREAPPKLVSSRGRTSR